MEVLQAAVLGLLIFLLAQWGYAAPSRMQFYMHDNFNLSPRTVLRVAGSANSTAAFGAVMVIDDLLTQGPSPASQPVGRAQGTYMISALDGSSLLLTFTAVFSRGSENGSTISFHGADRFLLAEREIAVIGGTGKFRMARGFAVLNTTSNTNRATIVGFDVTLQV
ncbi:hypothetical protein SELMODRAFT_87141 [Selaginella moellendorffii]|uniref:Dirigent protein n=1 Tax=Selaginella moellendorffii TaxID=88036 RepID=D8R866_SELML|nr:dirigent protein 11 [Selaginella moellendorffii]EFJ32006.1 hypothetical protein SELMODRAFT_87141 [Selaginella moellendorffii]|eukprot:XP_002967407.1 dirigent protein 11 [Selaginella moellendorffii]